MDVGVRDLKAHLSAYLRRAAGGERITITERGHPVAVIGPVPQRVDLSAGVAAGWITPAVTIGLRPVERHPARGSVMQALSEDRDG